MNEPATATRFQSFEEGGDRAATPARIAAVRAAMRDGGIQAFVVPRADEHQMEYVPPSAERLAWLTGFTGSAGTAIVLEDKAAIVLDGRYTLQAAHQVDTALVEVAPLATTSVEAWIEKNLPAGAKLGYDPWLHTPDGVKRLERAAAAAGGRIAPVVRNPVDVAWSDRPPAPRAPVRPHPEALAGESAQAKLDRIRAALTDAKLDALVVSDPHNLAWAFNLRGGDVAHTPVPLGYAVVPREGRPTLFLDPAKVTNEAGDAVGTLADLAAPEGLPAALAGLAAGGAKLRLDASSAAYALRVLVESAGGVAEIGADPITAMKAPKNAAEIAGTRAAHRRDGAAVTRFLAWLAREAPSGRITEIDAVARLEALRAEGDDLKELSFPTISGSGPNGAIVHYRVTHGTDRALAPGEMFLVDSGAQYEDGTTDVTRTIAVGTPSDEMRDRYTRVLKGHIAIATAVFPKGTTGAQIDAFARRPLWEAGLDFGHGTGHGVGSFLSVHEGPQRIAKTGHAALEPGMIVSNEPGYYKTGAYGIRLENLELVVEREVLGAEQPMLGFEALTFAPFDRALIEVALLSAEERAWLDAYHAKVRETVADALDAETRTWLEAATAPL